MHGHAAHVTADKLVKVKVHVRVTDAAAVTSPANLSMRLRLVE